MKKINQMEPWIGQEEKKAVADYLDSGGWLTEFEKTRELEKIVAAHVGSKFASVFPNGTLSLAAGLMALGLRPGDEVLVPDYTMIASPNSVVLAGLKPIFVDIDKKNLCLDFEKTKEAITEKTKAIMLVSINGRYPEIEKFIDFCNEKHIFLVEDAAQSLGSKYRGKQLGTFGIWGSFSFSMPKIITTGQGGVLVTDNEGIYNKILKIRDFGRTESGVDHHDAIGFNFKFTDLQAVIGIEQMKKLEWRVNRKKEIYKLYKNMLEKIRSIELIETSLENTAPWFIDILVEPGIREKLINFLKEKGIGTRPFYPAIHTQPAYSFVSGNFENALEIGNRGLWLPSSSFLSDEDIKYICNFIQNFYL